MKTAISTFGLSKCSNFTNCSYLVVKNALYKCLY